MRFRDWPPRRIAVMWLVGGLLQALALLIVPPLLGWERVESVAWEVARSDPARPDAPAAPREPITASADSTPPPVLVVTRTEVAPGDTLVRIARDSSWLQFRTRGGPVEMSQDVQQAAKPLGEALASMLVEAGRAAVQVMLLVFTIPAILAATTLAWLILRRLPPSAPR